MYASWEGKLDVVQYLIGQGANIEAKSSVSEPAIPI